MIHQQRGEYDQALEKYEQSLGIEKKLGSKLYIAICLDNIGILKTKQGASEEGISLLKQAIDIYRQIGAKAELEGAERSLKDLLDDE